MPRDRKPNVGTSRSQDHALDRLRALAKQTGQRETRSLVERRIDAILSLMCDGMWIVAESERRLATLWGISSERVQALAVEANRVLRRYMREDPDVGRDRLARGLQTFERIRFKAESMGTERGLQLALDAEVACLNFLGLKPVERHEVSGSVFANWTDDELKTYVETGKRPDHR